MTCRYPPFCRVDLGQTWRWRGGFSRARDLRQGAWWCSTFKHFLSNFKCKMTTFPEGSPLQCYHKPANMRGPPALRRWGFIVVCLTGIRELILLFRCSANDDACLVSYMMHEDGKRMTYVKVKVATLILLCWTSFTFQADSTLVRNASTQQKKQNGSTTTTNLNGLKMTGNAGTFFSRHVL